MQPFSHYLLLLCVLPPLFLPSNSLSYHKPCFSGNCYVLFHLHLYLTDRISSVFFMFSFSPFFFPALSPFFSSSQFFLSFLTRQFLLTIFPEILYTMLFFIFHALFLMLNPFIQFTLFHILPFSTLSATLPCSQNILTPRLPIMTALRQRYLYYLYNYIYI